MDSEAGPRTSVGNPFARAVVSDLSGDPVLEISLVSSVLKDELCTKVEHGAKTNP
jgi:hypothetical protein